MKTICTIFFLIKIHYPSNDIVEIRYFNEQLNRAMSAYCFLDVEYDLTYDSECADLEIFPEHVFDDYHTLGITYGNIHQNPRFYDRPSIYMNGALKKDVFAQILMHELFHFFGGPHSIDTLSLMHSEYRPRTTFTRNDSLILFKLLNR